MAWVAPGRIDQLTGGYLYDARVIHGLRARGHRVQLVELAQRLPLLDPAASVRLVRALSSQRWDAVVIDELAHPAMAVGLAGLRLAGPRPPGLVVGLVHHLRSSEPQAQLARRLAWLAERLAMAGIDLAICTSLATANVVKRVVRRGIPVGVITPGCDLHLARPEPGARVEPRDRNGRCLRVLQVAHLTPRKRVLDALRALALAPVEVELDLVGDPDRDPKYARRVQAELTRPELAGRVRAHGRVPSERLACLYRQADAALLASSHEGYGIVLAEALVAALPVVATRVGAVAEVVREGQEAELVEPGDVLGLARALERLARDPAERRRRARQAIERAATLPTWEESGAAFAATLERALDGREGR